MSFTAPCVKCTNRAEDVRQERQKALAAEGQKFLEENAQREGVSSTETGLQFSVLTQEKVQSHPARIVYAFTTPVN